ncbi:hypothetical protein, unlikely [Trypanosoma congolense IL3000]|uniref:Uncharacterized protein n=1 Tax=Trypanosoma congolense (strain IL3000) TaxID=1068625 RepID=F9WC15_TRYCI|nr:hypothetical protein, unlikely [Trypanosoma congolense IL3000]
MSSLSITSNGGTSDTPTTSSPRIPQKRLDPSASDTTASKQTLPSHPRDALDKSQQAVFLQSTQITEEPSPHKRETLQLAQTNAAFAKPSAQPRKETGESTAASATPTTDFTVTLSSAPTASATVTACPR